MVKSSKVVKDLDLLTNRALQATADRPRGERNNKLPVALVPGWVGTLLQVLAVLGQVVVSGMIREVLGTDLVQGVVHKVWNVLVSLLWANA